MRYVLADDLRAAIEPRGRQAGTHNGGQPPALPDRQLFEALLYLARTGAAWPGLPAEFGRRDAVCHRSRRWGSSGGLRRLFAAMTADPQSGDVRRVLIDSATVRAHPHAAGAKREEKRSGRPGRRRPRRSAAAAAG